MTFKLPYIQVYFELKTTFKILKFWHLLYFLKVQLIFTSSEITLKEKILVYDYDSLFADIGGYTGSLLGRSCFDLADMLAAFIEKHIKY